MNKIQALNQFWNSFREGNDWKAYDSSNVPEDISDKHITFDVSDDFFGYKIAQTINLWDKSTSWKNVTLKSEEIADFITRGGVMIPYDDGAMWIKRANPWAQRLSDDEQIKRLVLNIEIEFLN